MTFWFAPFTDLVKKKVCRYLLHRYLGSFIHEKISLDQLNVDFYNGKGTISDIVLDPEALNELCENQGWDIEVKAGHIGKIDVNIPWNALMSEDSFVEITQLYFELRPKCRPKDGASMIESMWSSMSSSMQLAKDCLEHESGPNPPNQPMEGLERFAQIIDNVLNRIKVRLIDTEIRLEYFTSEKERGITVVCKIKSFEYKNEAGGDPPDKPANAPDVDSDGPKSYSIPVYSTHQLVIENIAFYMEEFRISNGKCNDPINKHIETSPVAEQFYSTMSELPDIQLVSSTQQQQPQQQQHASNDEVSSCSDDDNDNDNASDISDISRTEALQIASFSGKTDIKITVKQALSMQGPKVQLELQLGAVNIFLTPRQLHALIQLADIFLTDSTNKQTAQNLVNDNDNDQASEYKTFNAMSGNLGLNQCWSSDPLGESQNQSNAPLDIDTIRETNSMSNSITSFASGYTQTTIRNRRRGVIEIDPNAEILRTNIRVASCAILLLQEDILVESPMNEDSPLNENSVRKLLQIAETFFDTIEDVNMNSAKDLKSIISVLDASCKRNHIRLILTPILIEGEEQRNNSGILLRLSISIPRADLREMLKDTTSVPLLEFYRDSSGGTLAKRPEINILLKQTTNMLGSSCGLTYEAPKTELSFMLAPCLCEFDISIIDRLSPVFNGNPFTTVNNDNLMNESSIQPNVPANPFSVTLESSSIDIRLRFPCTDLRPIHTPDRVPWWKRNVLRDSLCINFCQAKILYRLSKYEIVANKIDVYYSENEDEQKIHIGNIITYEQSTKRHAQQISESPKIIIELPTMEAIARNLQKQQPSDDSSDGGHHSDFSFHISNSNEPTPFSSKHVWRESDTPHAKTTDDGNKSQNIADDEKLLIPGDISEMNKFCDETETTSKLKIIVNLPIVSLQLRSKHMYEVIYNRIISNLLLWVPSAPNNITTKPQVKVAAANNPLLNINMTESISIPFSMAKSNIIYDSSSATNSDSDTDSENIFYSTYHESKRVQPKPPLASVTQSSACSLRLNINQGLLTAYSPVRDSANRVIPGQQGEFVIKLQSGSLFSVSGFRGNENLNYMCVQASAVEMYHIGLVPVPSTNPPLRLFGCVLPSHVQSTIYPTPPNLTVNQSVGKKATNREMISIAVQVKSVPERKVKRIKVSAGLQLATLRYNSALPEHSWLRQIMDMFNVEDYPIQGYTPLTNIMEMHLHLWDCSVDYRPRFYDYRAVLGINTFMMSTTLSSTNNGCTVRFVAEDGTLSIAPQTQAGEFKFKNENKITSLPSSELVCVFEFALLEISLRESEKVTEFAPKYDARAAMNGTHLRVCSDSCKSLGNLIAYIAAEGDLASTKEQDDENVDSLVSSSKDLDEDLIAVNAQNIPEVTEDQQQRVNQLMEEAMQDCIRDTPNRGTPLTDTLGEEDAETFYFPDEANPTDKSHSVGIASARKGLPSTRSNSSLNKDDEDTLSNITDCSRRRTTDLQDIIDFEKSVMGLKDELESEAVEALPLVDSELGSVVSPDSKKKSTKKHSRKLSSDTDDDFCFIGDEERPKYGIDNVQSTDEPIRIVDNHFSIPLDKHDMLKAPQGFPQAVTRYTICDLSISMHLYGGNDFPTTNTEREKEYEKASNEKVGMSDAYKKGVAFSKVSSTVTLPSKVKSSTPRSQRPWKERGGINRNFEVCVEIHSNKSRFSHETYPSHTREASRQVLVLSDFEVWDRLTSSSFNKMFYTGRSERSKKSDQATMYIKCIFIRPEPTLPSQEANLFISFMPKVNINIDQDAMLFIADFFAQLNGSVDEPTTKVTKTPSTPTHQPPVMIVDMPDLKELQARKMVDKNLMLLIDDEDEKEKPSCETATNVTDNNPVYFRSVTFSPEVELTINYCGKRVQFSHGPIMGLIMGLSHLNCSRIRLKKINYRRGLLGIDRVLFHLIKEWLNHIQNSQLPSLLQGIGPMNSIVIFFQGVIDLFRLPYEQYQRDGRIVRGIQLGAQSFTSRTALAALELTTRLIYLLQITAETAYDMVSPGPSVRMTKGRRRGKRKLHRPQDIREGVTNAYHIVKDGVGNTAQNIVEMATIEHDQKGVTGAVGAVIRQIPPSIVMPIVLATQATANVLGGVRNQLVPDAQIEAKEKWKEDDD